MVFIKWIVGVLELRRLENGRLKSFGFVWIASRNMGHILLLTYIQFYWGKKPPPVGTSVLIHGLYCEAPRNLPFAGLLIEGVEYSTSHVTSFWIIICRLPPLPILPVSSCIISTSFPNSRFLPPLPRRLVPSSPNCDRSPLFVGVLLLFDDKALLELFSVLLRRPKFLSDFSVPELEWPPERSIRDSSLISAEPPKEVLKAAMKGFRQAMLLEQMLKWASTMDQMTKKTPSKEGSDECRHVLTVWSRRMMNAIILVMQV